VRTVQRSIEEAWGLDMTMKLIEESEMIVPKDGRGTRKTKDGRPLFQ